MLSTDFTLSLSISLDAKRLSEEEWPQALAVKGKEAAENYGSKNSGGNMVGKYDDGIIEA